MLNLLKCRRQAVDNLSNAFASQLVATADAEADADGDAATKYY